MIYRLLQSRNIVVESQLSSELVEYLNSSKVENVPGFDAIKWWSNSNFKYLKQIAKDYLCISPTIFPSEKNLSSAELTAITNNTTSLDYEHFRKLTCLNSWQNN